LSNLFDLIFWPIPWIHPFFHFQGFQHLNSSIVQLFRFIQLWSCLRFVSLPWIKHFIASPQWISFKPILHNSLTCIHFQAWLEFIIKLNTFGKFEK
jgi:hypothetical protein